MPTPHQQQLGQIPTRPLSLDLHRRCCLEPRLSSACALRSCARAFPTQRAAKMVGLTANTDIAGHEILEIFAPKHRLIAVHSNQHPRHHVGLIRTASRKAADSRFRRGSDAEVELLPSDGDAGGRARRAQSVLPGIDVLSAAQDAPPRWMRLSAGPFRREGEPMGR